MISKNSDQPMTKSGNTIVFNGEIYNYLEIKKNLRLKEKNLTPKVMLKSLYLPTIFMEKNVLKNSTEFGLSLFGTIKIKN